jgi:uncharacterized protein
MFQNPIESEDELRQLIGQPSELVIRKELKHLDQHMRHFIAASPFVLLGTYSSSGQCDVSPRGDHPSVAHVIDDHHLAIADRPGNRRIDSLRNIMQTGRIGLLFLRPGVGETLRINGTAQIIRDANVLKQLINGGKEPLLAIGVKVEEAFFQCAKALIRSKLWEVHASPKFDLAQTLVDQTGGLGQTTQQLAEQIEQSYRERLY